MRLRPALAFLLLALPAFAGCVDGSLSATAAESAPEVVEDALWYELALPRDAGHDHFDVTQHQGASTPNFQLLGHDMLLTRDTSNRYVGSWGCGETGETRDGRRLAILDGFGRNAVVIADVTDASAPFKVGEIVMDGVSAYDTTLSPDGRWAILGLGTLARLPPIALAGAQPPMGARFVDACGEERAIAMPDLAASTGVMVFDLADPTNPTYADWAPTPAFNLHSVSAALVGGHNYVAASIVNLVHSASCDGKHYLVAGQECPYLSRKAPGGELFILDNTDPWKPTMVGRWNLPVDTSPWTVEYQASPHYVTVVGDTLFASMYHAGLWAIDISQGFASPPAVGVFVPDKASPVNNNAGWPSPMSWQVDALKNGDIVLYEVRTGIYVLRFDATNPAPPAYPLYR